VRRVNSAQCIVICGPTACGKTRLGAGIAARFNGEVISADSRQVYRSLDIGTGKDLDEYRIGGLRIPYHAIDIADPGEIYTLYRYLEEFNRSINIIKKNHHLPVVIGGSGLYIEAALKQYDVPHAPEDPDLRERLDSIDKDELVSILEKETDLFKNTDISSKKRIVRALEIAAYRKNGLSENPGREQIPRLDPLVIGVYYPREEIHRRIEERLHARLAQGMIEEVRKLIDIVPRERVLMLGMEYAHIARYIWGEISYDRMFESLYQAIRHLSKRQMTWFRGMERRGMSIRWIDGGMMGEVYVLVESFLSQGKSDG
jgi:tRNA dimethylallyltransferase